MNNDIIEYSIPSFKELSKKWEAPRIRIKKLLPDLTIYPSRWTYLVSNEKRPHTITLEEFRKKKLKAGDKVYFERGQIYNWAEYDVITDDNTFGSFGSGADPIFYGSDSYIAATWTSETGGYYSTPLATAPLWVAINGECARQGETDWIPTITNSTSNTIAGAPATLNAFNSVMLLANNTKLRMKEFFFRLSYEHLVTGYNTGTGLMNIGAGGVVGGVQGMPFKLYGQKQFATLEGDWWYDDPNNKLWIKTVATPSGTDIRVITENYAFKVNGASNATFENIDFTQYYNTAIDAPDAPNITVNNVDVHDNRTNAFMFYGNNTTFTLSNFALERIGLNAIHIGAVSGGSITDGTIEHTGKQDNIGWPHDTYWIKTGGVPICCFWDSGESVTQPDNVDIDSVVMSNAGYIGVLFIGDNHSATECIVHDFCEKWNDGGGFYTIHRNTLGTSTKNITFTRCHAYNGIGSIEGITPDALLFSHAEGFYIDNGSELVTIDECVAYNNSEFGILCNWDTQKTTITDCIVYGNLNSGVCFREDTAGGSSPVFPNNDGNIFTGNIITASDLNYCVEIISFNGSTTYNPFSDSGDSDNNKYVRPYGSSVNASRSTQLGTQTPYAIAAWRTRIADDASSTERYESTYRYKNPLKTRAEEVRIATNETSSTTTFNGTGYHSITGSALGSSENIAAFSAVVYLVDTWPVPDYLFDDFVAANGTAIAGRTPPVGPIPVIDAGTHTIQSQEMVSSVGGVVNWDIAQSNFDFTVRTRCTTTLAGSGSGLGTYFRRVNDNNRMVISFSTTSITLYEFNNSASVTNTWVVSRTFGNNDTYFISVRANGTSVKIWVNNILQIDITTSYTTAGKVGILGATGRATDYVLAESL
jgi:hypothetical protein